MNYFPIQMFKILCSAWRRRYVIAIPVLIFPLVGLTIGLTKQKLYQAHTSMLIQETAKMNPFLEDLSVSSMLKDRAEALLTLLHSRHILGSVAQELELYSEDSPDSVRDEVISRLSTRLSMRVIGKDLIRIELKANEPSNMKKTLQIVSEHFVEQLLAPERSSITDSSRFLEEHLAVRKQQLSEAENELAAFRAKYASTLPELHVMNIDRLNKLKQSLAEKETSLAGAQRSVDNFSNLLSATNPVVGRIEESLVSTRAELALARTRYTDKHSTILGLLRSLKSLERERLRAVQSTEVQVTTDVLRDMAANITVNSKDRKPLLISQLQNFQNANNKLEVLFEETKQLQSAIETMEASLKDFSLHENEMTLLERDLRVKRALYDDLLERYEMAEVMGSLGRFEKDNRIKIIDRPYTPSAPLNLPVSVMFICGIFAGVFLGIGLAVILELTDSSIRYRNQLEVLTGLPVIGRIPAMKKP